VIFESNFFSSQPETDMLLHRKCCTSQNSPLIEDAVHILSKMWDACEKKVSGLLGSLETTTAALLCTSFFLYKNVKIVS